jgi:hypothetical protein
MRNFKKEYRDLEMSVHAQLRNMINESNYISKHTNQKAIQVNVFDYTELSIINDRLTFLNNGGYHFSIYADASLEDLIDIL